MLLSVLTFLPAGVAAISLGQQKPLTHGSSPSPKVDSLISDYLTTKASTLKKKAEELYKIAELSIDEYNHPTRVIGSAGHLGTIDYIYKTLDQAGDGKFYTVSNQSFHVPLSSIYEARLVLGDKEPRSAEPMRYTPPTKNRKAVFGSLVLVDNLGCENSDYSSDVNGSIALIQRGDCSFGDKSALAGKAGAIAAVIYNDFEGPFGGTLGYPLKDHVPTFGISKSDAQPYIKKLKQGKNIESSAYIDGIVKDVYTTSVVAQTTGGDQDNCIMMGAHSDSVTAGPGINDDGSGTLAVLLLASDLAEKGTPTNCVRFAWWAAEEEGLLGSDYYVDQLSPEENLKIRMFLDYDMLASPNYAYQIYNANNKDNPEGSEEIRDYYKAWYSGHGLNYTMVPFDGRSDYDAFIRHGIPGGGIATGAEGIKTEKEALQFGGKAGDWYDPCYHQLCDDVSNLSLEAYAFNYKLLWDTLIHFSGSLKGFPKRAAISTTTAQSYKPKYHGSKIFI